MAEVVRRNPRGTAAADLAGWPAQEFDDIDSLAHSTFIQQLVAADASDVTAILTCPDEDEEDVWQYDHFRQFCMELNGLMGSIMCRSPDGGGDVEALSETLSILDGANATLTAEKHFPSRVTVSEASMRKLPGLARKLYRVLQYAHSTHGSAFQAHETSHKVCARFHAFAEKYQYMDPADLDIQLN